MAQDFGQKDIVIIGSGPSAVSCAMGLSERGIVPTLLDIGDELDPKRREQLARLASKDRDALLSEDLKNLGDEVVFTGGFMEKQAWGSSFPYGAEEREPLQFDGAFQKISNAVGGFSNLWGAAVLPYRDQDLESWPIRQKDLSPYYEKVLNFLPYSAVSDDLDKSFPLYKSDRFDLNISPTAEEIYRGYLRHKNAFAGRGLTIGRSRLAVKNEEGLNQDCVYCGRCLKGCPKQLIYNSKDTLKDMIAKQRIKYVVGKRLLSFVEADGLVQLYLKDERTGEESQFPSSKLILAAGSLGSGKIIMNSTGSEEITLKDSQYFAVPLLFDKEILRDSEAYHTLSQLFLELDELPFLKRGVHLQLYTYNDFYKKTLDQKLGPLSGMFSWVSRSFAKRMGVLQGYFHSDDSATFKLVKDPHGGFRVEADKARQVEEQVHRTRKFLAPLLKELKIRVLPVGTTITLPGKGYHSGGSYPMSAVPKDATTAINGKLYGFDNVFVADSSVFPSIPPTTITLTVMANAYRIGFEAGQ